MRESWRRTGIQRQDSENTEKRDVPRAKRRKRKDRREEEQVDWGLKDLVEENGDIRKWLRDTTRIEEDTEKRQTRLKTWNWLELEAKEVVMELARRTERQAEEKRKALEEIKRQADRERQEESAENMRKEKVMRLKRKERQRNKK